MLILTQVQLTTHINLTMLPGDGACWIDRVTPDAAVIVGSGVSAVVLCLAEFGDGARVGGRIRVDVPCWRGTVPPLASQTTLRHRQRPCVLMTTHCPLTFCKFNSIQIKKNLYLLMVGPRSQ